MPTCDSTHEIGCSEKIIKLIDSKTIGEHNGWIMFNATEPLATWIAFPDQNHGLFLKIKAEHSGE